MLAIEPILWCEDLINSAKCLDKYQAHSKHSTDDSYYHLKLHVLLFLKHMILFFSMLEFSVSDLYIDTLNLLRASLITMSASPTFTAFWVFYFQVLCALALFVTVIFLLLPPWPRKSSEPEISILLFSMSRILFLSHGVKETRWQLQK